LAIYGENLAAKKKFVSFIFGHTIRGCNYAYCMFCSDITVIK